MMEPDSLEDLPLMKHHTSPGDADSLEDYVDLEQILDQEEDQMEVEHE